MRCVLSSRSQTRKPKSVFIDVNGYDEEYEVLNVCEFNSSRKRMSVVVRGPDKRIKLYTKGADTVVFERLAPSQTFSEPTLAHLEVGLQFSLQADHTGLCYRRFAYAMPGISRDLRRRISKLVQDVRQCRCAALRPGGRSRQGG